MKSFQKFISEEVLPTAMVQDGNFDLRNDEVRDQINMILAGICSRSHVTPYVTLRKVSKALAYFSIFLPKKTFLEGQKGVEVYEMMQFGEKMGMNDSGEFIREVPPTYYLFFDYRGMLGAFSCMAKVVDKAELDKLLDHAETTMKECADDKVTQSERNAVKEPMHDVTSDPKKKGNKEAVADSKKGLHEVSLGKLVAYKNKAGEGRKKGAALADKKMKGKAKVNASAPKHPYMEETLDETRMPASVIKHKQKIANMTPEEKAKKFAGKSDEQLKSMARRHGYGKDSNEYSKTVKEEQIEEGQVTGPRSYKGSPDRKRKAVQMALGRKHKDHPDWNPRTNPQYSALKLGRQLQKQGVTEEETLDEKLTKKMSAGDVIHDFVHSDDPKFKGKSTKERQKMALGAYYGMHPEKSKKMEESMGDIKKDYGFRSMKRKVSTQVKSGLGLDNPSKTLQVTRKNDPSRKVLRISKDKFDPTKYVKV
jgi:hypothetical protein